MRGRVEEKKDREIAGRGASILLLNGARASETRLESSWRTPSGMFIGFSIVFQQLLFSFNFSALALCKLMCERRFGEPGTARCF
jgi:hypothetical protein